MLTYAPHNIFTNCYFVVDLFNQIHVQFCQLTTLLRIGTQ